VKLSAATKKQSDSCSINSAKETEEEEKYEENMQTVPRNCANTIEEDVLKTPVPPFQPTLTHCLRIRLIGPSFLKEHLCRIK
jgi:hypothetical protein